MLSTDFLLTSLIVVLIPGTGVMYTVSAAIFLGRSAGVAAALGCTFGIVPHLLASIIGISAILHMSAVAFQTVKYIGAAYLLYLSYSLWKNSGELQVTSSCSTKDNRRIVLKGLLINILNPKLSIFFLAFMPLFMTPETTSPLFQLLFMSLIFMLMTFSVFVIYGFLAHSARRHIVDSPRNSRYLQKTFAAAFAVFGIKLAMAEQ